MEMERRWYQNLLKLNQLQPIADGTKPYPDFQLTKTYIEAHLEAGIHKYYKSAAKRSEVKAFYVSESQDKNWILQDEEYRFSYRKEVLIISILQTKYGKEWDYIVSQIWRDKLR